MFFLSTFAITQLSSAQESPVAQVPGDYKVRFKVSAQNAPKMNYLLSLPADYTATGKPSPLIVFLHGGGERGNDLEKVKVHGPPKIAENNPNFPFVVIAPQCPEGSRWTYEIRVLKILLDDAIAKYNIDRDRIYLTGLSLGGYGTWNMALAFPEYFAAIAPMCGGGVPDEAYRIRDIPVWVFHGAKDKSNPLENNQRMVDAVKKAGGDVKFTIYPNLGHDCWTVSYNNPDLYTWFLSHRKAKK